MTTQTEPSAFYPPEGFGAPKDRVASGAGPVGLPAGTQVFSADDHISLAEDIFYQRLPASMREQRAAHLVLATAPSSSVPWTRRSCRPSSATC